MKKIISLFFAVTLLLLCFPITAGAEILETDGGIQYTVERGEVVIQGFNAAGTVMDIPEKIDGKPVTRIAAQACRGDIVITEVRIPKSVNTIGEYAFAECHNLTKVVIKGSVFIGRSAFRDCKALLTLKLPSNLDTIDDFAFEGCTMLGKVKIPKSLTHIGTDAFMGCEKLRFELNGNKVAKAHAKKYNIPTSFTDTWEFTVIMAIFVSLLLGGALVVANNLVKKKRKSKKTSKKRP
jgi:hypothetical protein